MTIVPFNPTHLLRLRLQPAQAFLQLDLDYAQQLAAVESFSALEGDEVLACGGIAPMWEGRGVLWSLLSMDVGRHMPALHKATVRFLDMRTERRIEATCHAGFRAGRRWLEMLGFTYEGTMRSFTPEGHDHDLFARVK